MIDTVQTGSRPKQAIAFIVAILVAAFVIGLAFLIASGAVTPQLVLWMSASIAISAFGGGLIFIVAALVS